MHGVEGYVIRARLVARVPEVSERECYFVAGLRSSWWNVALESRNRHPKIVRGHRAIRRGGAKICALVRPASGKRHSNPERENRGWSWMIELRVSAGPSIRRTPTVKKARLGTVKAAANPIRHGRMRGARQVVNDNGNLANILDPSSKKWPHG